MHVKGRGDKLFVWEPWVQILASNGSNDAELPQAAVIEAQVSSRDRCRN